MAILVALASLSVGAGVTADEFDLAASDLAARDAADVVLAGIGGPLCLPGGRERKTFLKVALAAAEKAAPRNELKPFDRTKIPGQTTGAGEAGGAASLEDVRLFDNLGTLHWAVTTSNPRAQQFFDQGLRLTYAFNHEEARRAFQKAQRLDPDCAMCYWGEALVLGPNINAPMTAEATAPAFDAVTKAQALAAGTSRRERALIDALAHRYSAHHHSEDPQAERAALDAAYAAAMENVARRFPRDQQIAVLYAEALMDLSPWDYWEAAGAKPKGRTAEIVATLERVLRANPDHPGAIHYYIHVVEASTNPQRGEAHARRLGRLMPGAGHIVHMPFHIYFRIGKYLDALEANRTAVAADESYLALGVPVGIYSLAYYPHNVHSLMASAQMAGDGKTAIAAAEKLARILPVEAAHNIPLIQPILAAPYFAHAQFSSPETVLALPDAADAPPYVQAMRHYARGVAYAAKAELAAAENEAEAIARLAREADFAALTAGGIPAADVLELARLVVSARIAQKRGDLPMAISEFERAVAVQDKLAYMEPPHWYYPVRQSLGAVLLLAGQAQRAEQVFRASLAKAPNNGWALYGLAEVHKRSGNQQQMRAAQRLLAKAWAGEKGMLDLARL
ncbi:MAG: hypothetical protein H7X91_08310 [Burkholderiales bacterium]|nr:hypothetical protein [Burkholderiales bacterium]